MAQKMADIVREFLERNRVAKGDVFPRAEIARLLGVRLSDYAHLQLRMVTFQAELERQLWDSSRPFTVRQRRGDIAILDDSDAAKYNHARFNKDFNDMFRVHKRADAVDVANLTAEEAARHERAGTVRSAVLAGMLQSRHEVKPKAHRRSTPGLTPA